MEGVRRLRIFLDGHQISKTRTPVSFKDLLKTIKKLNKLVSGSITIGDQNNRFEISNEQMYQEALHKTKSTEIILHLVGADPSSINTLGLIDKKVKTIPIKRKSQKVSPESAISKEINQNTIKTSEDCIDVQTKIDFGKIEVKKGLNILDKDFQLGPDSPKLDVKIDTHNGIIKQGVLQRNRVRSMKKQKIFDPEIMIKADNSNVDVLNSFSCIQDEGKLKIIDSDSSDFFIISQESINKSSRLLMTPDGLLITGGSSAPSQTMIVKSDYTISTLKPMNHDRYWHCMGYIGSCWWC